MSQTVLVADDSKTIRQIVGMALKASQYTLVEASSARSTLDALAQQRPDVVLLDYHMADGNGYDVCRTIKGGAQTRHIAVVMLGGTYRNFDENRAKQAGADAIVMKPFQTDDLLGAIEQALNGGASAGAVAPPSLPTPGLAPPPNPFSGGAQGSSLPPVPTPPTPSPLRSSQPAPVQTSQPAPVPAPAPTFTPTPAPASAPAPTPAASGSAAASAGVDKAQLESMVSDEVRRIVREELPGMLRSVLGNLVEQKLMPKIMQRSEQQVNQLMSTQLEQRVTSMVRVELEKLLSD